MYVGRGENYKLGEKANDEKKGITLQLDQGGKSMFLQSQKKIPLINAKGRSQLT